MLEKNAFVRTYLFTLVWAFGVLGPSPYTVAEDAGESFQDLNFHDDLEVVNVFAPEDRSSPNRLIFVESADSSPLELTYKGFYWGNAQTGFFQQNTSDRALRFDADGLHMRYKVLEPLSSSPLERRAVFKHRLRDSDDHLSNGEIEVSCGLRKACLLGSKAEIDDLNAGIRSGQIQLRTLPDARRIDYIIQRNKKDYIIIETNRLAYYGDDIQVFEGHDGQYTWHDGITRTRTPAFDTIDFANGDTLDIVRQFTNDRNAKLIPFKGEAQNLNIVYRFDADPPLLLKVWLSTLQLPKHRYRVDSYRSACSQLLNLPE